RNMKELIWLVPLLPLIGFLINGLGQKSLPKSLIGIIGSGVVLASFLISCGLFSDVYAARNAGEEAAFYFKAFDWISVGNFELTFSFLLDPLSAIMLLIVTGIGFLIHLYSYSYMHSDAGFGKFFAYLNLFIFFMLLLVLGSNYLIAVFGIIATFGSLEFSQVLPAASKLPMGDAGLLLITMMLFVAATGKSAQLPLFTWLPDAMAGPTPVSALIHAATMVTAGIYMIARSNVMFTLSPVTMEVIAIVGIATALLAAFIAITQNDIKKVLAYSTVSQLGY